MRITILSFIFLWNIYFCNAQDITYAHTVVNTLTSKKYSGRGYVNDGDHKAAKYIASQFKKQGLKEYIENYFQPFSFPVNTFPGKVEVRIDHTLLKPGAHYIVDPSCPSVNDTFEIIPVFTSPSKTDSAEVKNKFVLIDKSSEIYKEAKMGLTQWGENCIGAAGVIFLEEKKLTWSVGSMRGKFPIIKILKDSFPANAKNIRLNIESTFQPKHNTQNVVGYIKGKTVPDSLIVFTAHYDHLGMMGTETMFPGANDNACGIAMLLNLAEHYKKLENKYSMAFIAFAGEEAGLLGSRYYTDHPLFPLSEIKFLINLDLVGTGDDGIMVVNGAVYVNQYDLLNVINNEKQYVKSIDKRGKASNSDHYWFTEKGVPSFFIYTLGGIKAYHDIYDRAETLPFTDFEDVVKLLNDFVSRLN